MGNKNTKEGRNKAAIDVSDMMADALHFRPHATEDAGSGMEGCGSASLPGFPPHRISGRFIPIYNIGLQSVIQYENEEHYFHLCAFLFDAC